MPKTTIAAVLAAAVGGVLLGVPAAPLAAQEASLEDVLAHHYEAIGGLEKWKALKSMRSTGKITLGPGIEAPFTVMFKRPGKVRLEFSFQGMTGVQAYDGASAWMVMPFMGITEPQAMPADQAKQLVEQADLDGPLVGWKEDGSQLELMGAEDVEGTSTYKLKLTRKDGEIRYYFLDAEHYLPIKTSGKASFQGNEVDVDTTLGDYKPVNGLMVAHSISSNTAGQPTTITLDEIVFDVPLEDSLFAMPGKDASGGA
ncbi:MAG: hypothetical protein ACE5HQ_09275 [Gemmatimonadota bacterium]